MKIIAQSKRVNCVSYSRVFQRKNDSHGSGFAFECDEKGTPLQPNRVARIEELKLDNTYQDMGIEKREWSYKEAAIGECNYCKKQVYLDSFTNTCECGADYNSAGQELAPREQWGEETGENLSDILRIK